MSGETVVLSGKLARYEPSIFWFAHPSASNTPEPTMEPDQLGDWTPYDAARLALEEAERERDAMQSMAAKAIANASEAEDRAEKTEAYAKEGWDWLGEALDALGVEDVFGIAGAKREQECGKLRASQTPTQQVEERTVCSNCEGIDFPSCPFCEDGTEALGGQVEQEARAEQAEEALERLREAIGSAMSSLGPAGAREDYHGPALEILKAALSAFEEEK